MKITKNKLKQLIKEELNKIMQERIWDEETGRFRGDPNYQPLVTPAGHAASWDAARGRAQVADRGDQPFFDPGRQPWRRAQGITGPEDLVNPDPSMIDPDYKGPLAGNPGIDRARREKCIENPNCAQWAFGGSLYDWVHDKEHGIKNWLSLPDTGGGGPFRSTPYQELYDAAERWITWRAGPEHPDGAYSADHSKSVDSHAMGHLYNAALGHRGQRGNTPTSRPQPPSKKALELYNKLVTAHGLDWPGSSTKEVSWEEAVRLGARRRK